jgi:DNA-binding transcriptional LysR family regulator
METGSITGASQRLRISQPSASKHLQGLEQSIGVTLFVRTGNRLVATSEAQAFYAQVERSFYGLEHLARFADGLKHHPSGQIVVAAPPMLARQWLPEIMAPFLKEHVDVSIALPIRSSRWVAEAIANGQADLGLGLAVVDFGYVEQESLMRVPLVCAMQNAHPLTSLTEVRPSDLADQTLITLSNFDHWRLAVETALDQEQARPRQRVDTFSTQVACPSPRGIAATSVHLPLLIIRSECVRCSPKSRRLERNCRQSGICQDQSPCRAIPIPSADMQFGHYDVPDCRTVRDRRNVIGPQRQN